MLTDKTVSNVITSFQQCICVRLTFRQGKAIETQWSMMKEIHGVIRELKRRKANLAVDGNAHVAVPTQR